MIGEGGCGSRFALPAPQYTSRMAFNSQLARKIVESQDRDKALFFAGRETEIASFALALRQSRDSEQAVFRIFQGPPGCGKTSLAKRLEELHHNQSLFVRPEGADLTNRENVDALIRWSALRRSDKAAAGATLIDFAAAVLKNPGLGERAREIVVDLSGKRHSIVFHIDEAQSIPAAFDERLKELHKTGLGRSCVVLFTGLSHTEDRIYGIDGLSRGSLDAEVNMGDLEAPACIESTEMLLKQVGAHGADFSPLAATVSKLSKGWPAHLHSAQKALCEELVRLGGSLDKADAKKIEARSDSLRHAYYEKRLRQPPFSADPKLTHEIVSKIQDRTRIETLADLSDLCLEAIRCNEKARQSSLAPASKDADEFALALYHKGIVKKESDGIKQNFSLAIPSMGDWAKEKLIVRGASR